jgi:hypothetical protein
MACPKSAKSELGLKHHRVLGGPIRDPDDRQTWVKEQPFIAGLAAAYTLSGLALLYTVVSGEYAGAAWFIWTPIVIRAVLGPIMWWLATED